MYGLQVIANYLQEAIKYAKASTLDEEYGFLLFTYIKTDINGNRSAHEDKVHCMKKPEGSPKSHPFVKMLDAKYKIDDRRSSKDGITFRYGGEPWNLTREQKDLAELSKKLCRRYFSFEKGSFYIKGQTPMRFDK